MKCRIPDDQASVKNTEQKKFTEYFVLLVPLFYVSKYKKCFHKCKIN